jgi:hypothetical protein
MALDPFASRNSDLYARSLFSDRTQEQSDQVGQMAREAVANQGYVMTRQEQAAARACLARAGGATAGGSSFGMDLLKTGAGAAVGAGVSAAATAAFPAIAAAI